MKDELLKVIQERDDINGSILEYLISKFPDIVDNIQGNYNNCKHSANEVSISFFSVLPVNSYMVNDIEHPYLGIMFNTVSHFGFKMEVFILPEDKIPEINPYATSDEIKNLFPDYHVFSNYTNISWLTPEYIRTSIIESLFLMIENKKDNILLSQLKIRDIPALIKFRDIIALSS